MRSEECCLSLRAQVSRIGRSSVTESRMVRPAQEVESMHIVIRYFQSVCCRLEIESCITVEFESVSPLAYQPDFELQPVGVDSALWISDPPATAAECELQNSRIPANLAWSRRSGTMCG